LCSSNLTAFVAKEGWCVSEIPAGTTFESLRKEYAELREDLAKLQSAVDGIKSSYEEQKKVYEKQVEELKAQVERERTERVSIEEEFIEREIRHRMDDGRYRGMVDEEFLYNLSEDIGVPVERVKEVAEARYFIQSIGYVTAIRNLSRSELALWQNAAFGRVWKDPHAMNIANQIQWWTLGRGIRFHCDVPEVQDILEKFWRLNDMEIRHKKMVWSTFVEGEDFRLFHINKATGRIRLRKLMPIEIRDIEVHPADNSIRLAYHYVRDDDPDEGRWYADADYFEQLEDDLDGQRSAHHDELAADRLVQMIKYGCEEEVSGRTPFQPILRFLKYYEIFVTDRMRLNHERSKVLWIQTITGGRPETTERDRRAPAGGVMLTETEHKKYRTESAKIEAPSAQPDGRWCFTA